jgi:hypothetical protein
MANVEVIQHMQETPNAPASINQQRKDPGKKHDSDKLRYDLIPALAIEELAKAYTHGVKEYEDENWRKGMHWKRIIGGIFRHLWAWIRGETWDKDSGCHHLASAAWGCFTLIEYELTQSGTDDRWRYGE